MSYPKPLSEFPADSVSRTRFPYLWVARLGKNWRIVARDECTDHDVTGPLYLTKGEALAALDPVRAGVEARITRTECRRYSDI